MGRVIQETVTRMKTVADGEGLLLQPHKKDRSVYVIRRGASFGVFEKGFSIQHFTVDAGKLKKLLKTICRREFPRSNKVWVSKITAREGVEILQKGG